MFVQIKALGPKRTMPHLGITWLKKVYLETQKNLYETTRPRALIFGV